MSTKGIDGFVEAGAYAAEMARSILLGTPIAKTSAWQRATTTSERAMLAQRMEIVAEKERRAAEASALAAAIEDDARARREFAQLKLKRMLAEAEQAVDAFAWM